MFWDLLAQDLRYAYSIPPSILQQWNKRRIYEHMGLTFFKLLKLMRICPIGNEFYKKIVMTLTEGLTCVLKAITINVYCTWAEVIIIHFNYHCK